MRCVDISVEFLGVTSIFTCGNRWTLNGQLVEAEVYPNNKHKISSCVKKKQI